MLQFVLAIIYFKFLPILNKLNQSRPQERKNKLAYKLYKKINLNRIKMCAVSRNFRNNNNNKKSLCFWLFLYTYTM